MALVADKYALFMVTSLFQKEKKIRSSYVETVFESNLDFLEKDTSGEVKENSHCNPGFCVLPLKTCHILK